MDAGEDFDHFYERHARALHAYLLGRTGEPATVEDLLQECFLRAWRHRATALALPEERQRAWLFTVAGNGLTDFYRRRATSVATREQLARGFTAWASAPEGVAARVEDAEQLQRLDTLIGQLPDEQRTILLLQALGGLTSGEIGAALDRPAGTIRYQLSLARRALAIALERDNTYGDTHDARPARLSCQRD